MKLSLFSVLSAVFCLTSQAEIEFNLMHTKPVCDHEDRPATWCTSQDTKKAAKAAGMEEAIREMLDKAKNPKKAKISIGYFSFSNSSVFEKLCERGKDGITIEGFFDSSAAELSGAFSERLAEECQGPEGDNVHVYYLGTKSPWRLHHNKFLLVDSGSGPVRLNFSSGNLSSYGLSIHFDHWVMLEASRSSDLVQQHLCVIESLKQAVDSEERTPKSDDPDVYRETLNECLAENSNWTESSSWVEKALKKEKIAPLFSPDPKNNIYKVLAKNIDEVVEGGKIYGAMQHFLHTGLAEKLQAAQERGVEVTLLMDDDVVLGDSEVPGVGEFFREFLDPSVSGFNLFFMQTNSDAGNGRAQMMHNKYLILDGVSKKGKKRVFSGAGHFTTAGMKNNYENFYLSEVKSLTEQYDELFNFMNEYSVSEEEVN